MSDEPTDRQKDRAIAEHFGDVSRVARGEECYVPSHNHILDDEGVYFPAYSHRGDAFVILLRRLREAEGVGYSIQSNDISVKDIDCATVLYTLGGKVWAQSKAFTGDPMTALRDVVYAWVQKTGDE